MIIPRIWKEQPGKYFCISTKSSSGTWKDHFFKKEEFESIPEFLSRHREDNVYFCPHGFKSQSRTKSAAVLGSLLWADMDETDPQSVKWVPTIAIESSPGRYVGLWKISGEVSEDLNRRLSYAVSADRSGWDLTQVLRYPGTINHKYPVRPRVRVKWSNGDIYDAKQLASDLPAISRGSFEEGDSSKIWKKYERKLKFSTRRELMATRVVAEGKRSEVLMRLAYELMEAGMTREEGVTLLKGSVWNKYQGRGDEDRRLLLTWDKAVNKKLGPDSAVVGEREVGEPQRADSLSFTETRWLWWPRIPRGAISVLGARGGTGKGLVCADIAARVTTGECWPMARERAHIGNVLWCEAEDKLEATVIPRLIAAKADLSRIFFTKPSEFKEYDIPQFLRTHRISLMIMSPMISFLEGMTDANAQLDTRQALENLDSIVDGTDCAVLGVMHLNKKPDLGAVERLLGSVEFANYPRSVMLMSKDEDQIVRFTHGKYNLGPRGEDLIFKSINRRERSHPRGQFIGVEWEMPEDQIDPDRVFEKGEAPDTSAAGWLREVLAGGAIALEDIYASALKASHSASAVRRARLRMGREVRVYKEGGKAMWSLSRPS